MAQFSNAGIAYYAERLTNGALDILTDRNDAIVSLPFGAFTVSGNTAIASGLKAKAVMDGTADTWRAVTPDGEVMISGIVGADLTLDRVDIQRGGTVTIEEFVIRG